MWRWVDSRQNQGGNTHTNESGGAAHTRFGLVRGRFRASKRASEQEARRAHNNNNNGLRVREASSSHASHFPQRKNARGVGRSSSPWDTPGQRHDSARPPSACDSVSSSSSSSSCLPWRPRPSHDEIWVGSKGGKFNRSIDPEQKSKKRRICLAISRHPIPRSIRFTLEGRACLCPQMTGYRTPPRMGAFRLIDPRGCSPPARHAFNSGGALNPTTRAHTQTPFLLGSKAGKRARQQAQRR